MTKELFQKWIPINNLASAYDVESIICGEIISLLSQIKNENQKTIFIVSKLFGIQVKSSLTM